MHSLCMCQVIFSREGHGRAERIFDDSAYVCRKSQECYLLGWRNTASALFISRQKPGLLLCYLLQVAAFAPEVSPQGWSL